MYLRGVHADATIATLRKLIHDNPLGILTTAIRSPTAPFIQSSHIPFVLDVEDEDSETELGVLRGHVARANPQSKAMIEAVRSRSPPSPADVDVLEEEVLVLFNSTAQHYVTPKFYVETKPATGKVVPTWNYAAAQVYGRARIYWDHKSPDTIAFLSKQINDLSDYAEERIMDHVGTDARPCPWKVSDAPETYVNLLQKAIVGIEIKIERLEGKFKMSQELSAGDREGVIQGFKALGTEAGCHVSSLVKERGELKDQKAHR